jgi:hypothetical protein
LITATPPFVGKRTREDAFKQWRKRKRQCREISARGRRSVGRGKTTKRREGVSGKGRKKGETMHRNFKERMRAGKSFKRKRKKGVGIQGKGEDVFLCRNYDGFPVSR